VTTTATKPRSERIRGLLQSSSFLAVSTVAMNVATYGFQMVAARLLGNEKYGGIASLMALLLILGVFQLGLQATSARRVAAAPDNVEEIEQVMKAVTYRTAYALGAVMLVLSPAVWKVLQLDSILPALLVAITAVPLTIMGGQAGILQGERRWFELSLVYLAFGIPRLIVGIAAMVIRPTEGAAMAAVTVAQFAPVAVGWWVLRHRRSATPPGALRASVTEMLHGSFALLGFFVLSNADILIARNILPGKGANASTAGLYASGLILTKAVLFLPQFVVVVAFPSMSTAGSRLRSLVTSLGAVAVVGVLGVLATAALSGLALVFVGGDDYAGVQHRLWLFAVLGTFLSLLQLLVYSVLARQHRLSAYLIWIAVAALIGFGVHIHSMPRPERLNALLHTVIAIDGVLMVVLTALSLWNLRDEAGTIRNREGAGRP
jgi:O-antigen/teichoic acid export membrane protein